MARYPKYRTTDVIGHEEIPEHWALRKATRIFDTIGSGTTPNTSKDDYYDGDTPWITTAELRETTITRTLKNVTDKACKDHTALRLYKPGAVAIAMYGATIGRLGILGVPATVNQACCVFDHSAIVDNRFFYYWLWSFRPVLISLSSGGGQPNLSQEDLRSLQAPVPALSEQAAIVTFLDRETARIDVLIEKKRRLLELLEEKRLAIITHAVTKGHDPKAPMRDSGIDWLGQIPNHWTLGRIASVQERITYGFTNPMPTEDDGPFMLTANDIDYGRVRYETARRTSQDAFDKLITDKSRPKVNDILLTKDGTLGRVAVFDGEPACINQSVALVRLNQNLVNPEFVLYCLVSSVYQDKMIFDAGGTTIKHIYITRFAKMPFAFPNMEEQAQILVGLKARLRPIEEMVGATDRSISLLTEYRCALITNAVTGKIDVRGEMAKEAAA